MEFGILAGVAAVGYILNQKKKEQEFIDRNQVKLNDYLRRHDFTHNLADKRMADTYPLYAPRYMSHQQSLIDNLPEVVPRDRKLENITIEKERKKFMDQSREGFDNVLPSNDPVANSLLEINKRPISDFQHNNMVPFYKGNGTGQNMAGTGVPSGDYVEGTEKGDINAGFDDATPWKSVLNMYTGLDETYLHKREAGPLFSPAEQQTDWVNGAPLIRPDLDRYSQGLSNIRNDLRPVEAEMVGPGMNIDPSIPASGGFHDFTRVLPNNVSDYKANQLPGQVITGKFYSAGLPTSYPGVGSTQNARAPGVVKNRPNTFWDQSRYPTMTNKVGYQVNVDYNIPQYEVDFKPKNATRDQTSYGLGNNSYKKYIDNLK